jgi:hypothetical protein
MEHGLLIKKVQKRPLEEQNMFSLNQMAAQIKPTEMWKTAHDPLYPIKIKKGIVKRKAWKQGRNGTQGI